ncbi:MAG: glycine cleavage system protein GcvH [Pirellulaceae bacterium]|jgi:glycine cleavage system H protein|nr:glycine cleavage system protein GcvH [Pirellulaceae bacterium]
MDPNQLKYAETHEWAFVEGDTATVGITAHAVEQLTDLVYMDLPQVGGQVSAGKPFGEVESVKATSDLYSPVDGEVIEVNTALPDRLEILNSDPYGQGWIMKVKLSSQDSLNKLLDLAAYEQQCSEHG